MLGIEGTKGEHKPLLHLTSAKWESLLVLQHWYVITTHPACWELKALKVNTNHYFIRCIPSKV